MVKLALLLFASVTFAFAFAPARAADSVVTAAVPSASNNGDSACQVGSFGAWSKCDPATQTKSRARLILQTGGKASGKACPSLEETATCTPSNQTVEAAVQRASEVPLGGLALVVIDQQVDFHPGGSLAIPTANDDATRIAAFITTHADKISQLVFTLDSHQRYHIAHGIFWTNAQGESPAPFTAITHQAIATGVWSPRDASLTDYVLAYTAALETSNKFVLSIWPEHCVLGTPGHNIVPTVHAAALAWAKRKRSAIQYVLKGTNSFTEHYSALRAEYELAYDPATALNRALIANLAKAATVAVVGEALSHCVNYSVRDLVANWPRERRKDLYLFTDCSSAVPGFEVVAGQFVADMETAGLNVMNSTAF